MVDFLSKERATVSAISRRQAQVRRIGDMHVDLRFPLRWKRLR